MQIKLGRSLERVAEAFPGQNAREVGMGEDLYMESRTFAEVVDAADQILGTPSLGSIKPDRQFSSVTFSLAAAKAVSEALGNMDPANGTALSIGENALLIRHGIAPFEPVLRGLALREKLTEGRQRLDGYLRGMLAVIGINPDDLNEFVKMQGGRLTEGIEGEMVNLNSPYQGVMAINARIGERVEDLKDVVRELKGRLPFEGIRLIPLSDLTSTFHSRFNKKESEQFQGEVTGLVDPKSFQCPSPERRIFLPTIGKFVTDGYQAFLAYVLQLTNKLDFRKPWQEFGDADLQVILTYDPKDRLAQIIRDNLKPGTSTEVLNIADLRSFDSTINALLKNPTLI